jgi:hypothetical protein
MSRIFLLVLATVIGAAAGDPGLRAQFIGGTLVGVKAKANARLDFTAADALALQCGEKALRIDYKRINTLEYGQNVSRRYAAAILLSPMFLLSKARRHFVTIGYLDEAGAQQALVLRVDKNDVRSVLASLEARTGRRVEYQDDEARKGRG